MSCNQKPIEVSVTFNVDLPSADQMVKYYKKLGFEYQLKHAPRGLARIPDGYVLLRNRLGHVVKVMVDETNVEYHAATKNAIENLATLQERNTFDVWYDIINVNVS
jgi:hypothetical protein